MAPLIVITGPTASGKSSLAMKLASQWGGEIICADSRTIYRHMDIGTAKPTIKEQQSVPHWLLDLVEPGERFTAADFQKLALEAIADIRQRHKIPLLVGGTGLYIDSVVLGYTFGPEADLEARKQLEKLTVSELHTLLHKQHITLPENQNNKRHLIRSYEKNNVTTSRKQQPDSDTYVVAINTGTGELERRIRLRANEIFSQNIVQETQHILTGYGVPGEAFTGNIYPLIKRYLDGDLSYEQAKELFIMRDRQLVKRQLTWLKRHDWVQWLTPPAAEQYFSNVLSNYRDSNGY